MAEKEGELTPVDEALKKTIESAETKYATELKRTIKRSGGARNRSYFAVFVGILAIGLGPLIYYKDSQRMEVLQQQIDAIKAQTADTSGGDKYLVKIQQQDEKVKKLEDVAKIEEVATCDNDVAVARMPVILDLILKGEKIDDAKIQELDKAGKLPKYSGLLQCEQTHNQQYGAATRGGWLDR